MIIGAMNEVLPYTVSKRAAMRLLTAVLMAMFLFVNVAEAATCADEQPIGLSHAAEHIQDENDGDENGEPSEKHAVCGHGHCHHFGKILAPNISEGHKLSVNRDFAFDRDDTHSPAYLSKLKRPPRL